MAESIMSPNASGPWCDPISEQGTVVELTLQIRLKFKITTDTRQEELGCSSERAVQWTRKKGNSKGVLAIWG